MFADAYAIASDYTWPVVISSRLYNGSLSVGMGSLVVLNKDGWFMTAGHIVSSIMKHHADKKEIYEYQSQKSEIENSAMLNSKKRKQKLRQLQENPSWITHHSYWWGRSNLTANNLTFEPTLDLAIGQLEPFDPSWVKHYPIIKNPNMLRPGTSLCKLGFPFNDTKVTFDEQTSTFNIVSGNLTRFPIEGIFTREHHEVHAGKTYKFIETSSPGLRGQSGGPIFDANGILWAIQVKTRHFNLGFAPIVKRDNKDVVEHQFLNVGIGVHPEVLIETLKERSIKFTASEE